MECKWNALHYKSLHREGTCPDEHSKCPACESFKVWAFKVANMLSHVQSCKLAPFKEALLSFRGTGPEHRLVHERQEWVPLQLALHLLLLMTLRVPPTLTPFSSQWLFFPVHSMPAPRCQLLYSTAVLLFKVLYCKILFYFIFFVLQDFKCFLYFFVFVFHVLFVWKVLYTYYSIVLYSQLY